MLCRKFIFNLRKCQNNLMCLRTLYAVRTDCQYPEKNKQWAALSDNSFLSNHQNCYVVKRFKYNKKKSIAQGKRDDDDDEEEEEEESHDDLANMLRNKGTKMISTKVTSMRLDLIVKAGLSVARNKVELLFYDSRLRRNGAKVFKKSIVVQVGDELDVIRGTSPDNPKFLIVTRITILSASGGNDGIEVKLLRDKALLIENYDTDPWKASASTPPSE